MNSTVQGVVRGEDVDYFVVELKKGQTLQVELEGLRHSYLYNFFDPYVAIYDDKRFQIAASDDSVFLQQDCLAAITAPEDGSISSKFERAALAAMMHASTSCMLEAFVARLQFCLRVVNRVNR